MPVIDFVLEGTVDVAIQAAIAAKMDMDQWVKEQIARGMSEVSLLDGDGDL